MNIKDYYEVYDNAIALNKETRDYGHSIYLELHRYMREFATIYLNLVRRTYKTTYIDNRSNPRSDIIINKYQHHNFLCRNYWIGTDFTYRFKGMRLPDDSTIWVDDYSAFTSFERENLMKLFYTIYGRKTQTIILMG